MRTAPTTQSRPSSPSARVRSAVAHAAIAHAPSFLSAIALDIPDDFQAPQPGPEEERTWPRQGRPLWWLRPLHAQGGFLRASHWPSISPITQHPSQDKAVCRFQVKNIVESAAQRDIRDACAFESKSR